MAKNRSKGVIFSQEISAVYTPIAQLTTLSLSGAAALTYDSTTLDGGAPKTYANTGYAETPEFSAEAFYDAGLSGHQSFTDLIETPAETNFRITHTNTGATTQTFATVGHKFDLTFAMEDGVKGTIGGKVTGTSNWPT